jgi:PAS domain S-box-containing protein
VTARVTDDDFVAAVEHVIAAGQAACEALDTTVETLAEGCRARLRGRPMPEVVDGLIAGGGREVRLASAEAFRDFERAVAAMRAGVARGLVDDHGLTLTEVADQLNISRQAASRLYQAYSKRPVDPTARKRRKSATGTPGVRSEREDMTIFATGKPRLEQLIPGQCRPGGQPDAELIAESVPHIVFTASPDGATTYFNRQGTEYTGLPAETNYGWNWFTLVHPADVQRAGNAWQHAIATGTEFDCDYRIRRHDGTFRWHAARAVPLRNEDGRIHLWVSTATDIESHKQREISLREVEQEASAALTLLESIEAAAPIGFALVDRDFRIVRMNQLLARVNGGAAADQIGRTVAEVLPDLWPRLEAIYGKALGGEAVSNLDLSVPNAEAPGQLRHWLASYYPVRVNDEIVGVGTVLFDITERREAEEFRRVVMDNMTEGLYALDADGRLTYMNPAASRMLGWTVEELLGKPMHETVHFQRADGSPIPAQDCPLLHVREQGRTIRILDDAFTRKDSSIFPIAYSSAPLQTGGTPPGVVVVFRDTTEEKEEQASLQRQSATLTWVGKIRDAIDEQRLTLHSQPIRALKSGRPSQELLLRMIGRDGELIQPGSFLPTAEKYGLIGEIDRWVISEAIALAVDAGGIVEANISAASIGTVDLLPFIEHRLKETGADPANLVFEITETALMHDIAAGEAFAQSLAELGCALALDDFGTGFGSFTYLKRLPISYLKIDIEFVRDLVTNPANQHVVRAIVSLATAFGLQTIAEGVEDEATLQLLREEGVDYAQGYHLGRPAPLKGSCP